MNALESLRARRDELLRIAKAHGARNVRLFGSAARGDGDDASDIDLLVEMEPGRSLLDMGALLVELEELLGCPVDVVTEKGLGPRVRERALRDAVSL